MTTIVLSFYPAPHKKKALKKHTQRGDVRSLASSTKCADVRPCPTIKGLPGKFQTYCFIGSMCPFGLYLPANLLLGDLCVSSAASHNDTATGITTALAEDEAFGPLTGEMQTALGVGGGDDSVGFDGNSTGGGTWVARWSQVETFFAMCCILTVLGCAAIVAAMFSNAVKYQLLKRDLSLKQARKPSTSNIYEDSAVAENAPLVQGTGNGDDGSASRNSAYEQSLSQMQLWKIIWVSLGEMEEGKKKKKHFNSESCIAKSPARGGQ